MLFLAEESGIMTDLLRSICMFLCEAIYAGIIRIYEIFMAIGGATIISSSQVQVIYDRIGLILGIVMMFRLVFSFVQYMLDPDKMSDKENGVGGIIKKVIVVILALGLSSWVFDKAFEVQDMMLEENVIGKVVLGMEDQVDMENYAVLFSYFLFSNFYYQSPDLTDAALADADGKGCGPKFFGQNAEDTGGNLMKYIGTFKDFSIADSCVNVKGKGEEGYALFGNKVYYVGFDGIFAVLVGAFVFWILLMYTITLGVRVVKLAFLRIIAPVPILSYLAPKKNDGFNNWIKQSISTYLDLFIRIAIIYFAMLLISIIFTNGTILNDSITLSTTAGVRKWIKVILVLAVLLFAKKMPDILGDLFPSMSGKSGLDFGLGLKSRTDFAGKGALKRVAGAAIGAGALGAVGAVQGFSRLDKNGGKPGAKKKALNTLSGAASGVARGAWTGVNNGGKIKAGLSKGFKTQVAASAETNQYVASGFDGIAGRTAASVASAFGLPSSYEKMQSEVTQAKERIKKAEHQVSANQQVQKGHDGIMDSAKKEVNDNKSKILLNKDSAAAALLQKSGIIDNEGYVKIGGEKSNYQVYGKNLGQIDDIIGTARTRISGQLDTASGAVVNKQAELKQLELKKLSTEELSKYERELRDINQEITINPSKGKELETRKLSIEKAISDNNQVNNSINQLEKEIKIYQDYQSLYEKQLEDINLTEIQKKLGQATYIEAVLGSKDAKDDMKFDIKAQFNNIDNALTANKQKAAELLSSNDEISVKMGREYENANDVIIKLKTAIEKVQGLVDDKGNYDNVEIQKCIDEVARDESLKTVVNFDNELADGTHGTKDISSKIGSVFDLFDQISELSKNTTRATQQLINKDKLDVDLKEQSLEMLKAKAEHDHKSKWFQ